MWYICVECEKTVRDKNVRGFMEHPYCKKCFKKVWNNDYDEYSRFLDTTRF